MNSELGLTVNANEPRRTNTYRGRPATTQAAGCCREGVLSPHEIRVLSLLVEGHTLTTAAVKLDVSRATVAWHMRNIYGKLHVHSKSAAVATALRLGVIH